MVLNSDLSYPREGYPCGLHKLSCFSHTFIQSYDYDAPIQEHGDFTDKARATREILQEFNLVDTLPDIPANPVKTAYGSFNITGNVIKKTPLSYSTYRSQQGLNTLIMREFLHV